MADISNLEELNAAKGFKIVHLNVRSILKKIDQLRTYLFDSRIDVLTISETWLKPHLCSTLVDIEGFTQFRMDRNSNSKRGGGLLTYIRDQHVAMSKSLTQLNQSNSDLEAQWTLIQMPHSKNMVICNIYRPPKGDLQKAMKYLDDCLKTVNISKVNVFLIGDLNVNYQTKQSPAYKKLLFFTQANSLTQHINSPTRNTNTSKSLIDLILTNSKFVSKAGTLEYFISDH